MDDRDFFLFFWLIFLSRILLLSRYLTSNFTRIDSQTHGGPTSDHSYYIAFKFLGCTEKDHPALHSYTVAVVRFIGESPTQIGYFDLNQFHPVLKEASGKWTHSTKFPAVHDKFYIGSFPTLKSGLEQGVLIDLTTLVSNSRTAVRSYFDDELHPNDDNFVTVIFLMNYPKRGENCKMITRLLSLNPTDTSHHDSKLPIFHLSSHFDDSWKLIASVTVQAVGISTSHSQVQSSPILFGLQRTVKDFEVVIVPNIHGGIMLDIPLNQAVRKCSDEWVLTQQSSNIHSTPNCDENTYELTPLIVVPSTFNWKKAYYVNTVQLVDAGDEAEQQNCEGKSPPSKRRKIDTDNIVSVLYVVDDTPCIATVPLKPCHRLIIDHKSQVSISNIIFSSSGEQERLRTLASRSLYTNREFMMRNMYDLQFSGDLCFTQSNCERVFDIYSHILYGTCTKADEIKKFVLKKLEISEADASIQWNQKLKGRCPCFTLYDHLKYIIPLNLIVKCSKDTDFVKFIEHFEDEEDEDLQDTPVIYIDGVSMKLLSKVNGLTDEEFDAIGQCKSDFDAPSTACSDEEDSSGGYCGDEDKSSEMLQLMRETHKKVAMLSDGVTTSSENMILLKKMLKFRTQQSPLMNMKDNMKKEIVASKILSSKQLSKLTSDVGSTYFDFSFDKSNDKIAFNCVACKKNGITNAKKRSVEWEMRATDSQRKVKSTLKTMRAHHLTEYHMDSVRALETGVETTLLDEIKMQKTNTEMTMTEVVFRSSYYVAKMFLPGYRFPEVCQLVRDIGVPLGHINTGRKAHIRVLMAIAKKMRKRMIEYLTNHHTCFGLQLDTSTDSQGRVVLMLYISAVINEYPRHLFYAAIYLESGETGGAIFKAIIDRFEEDEWISHLDNYLTSITSDGAPSLISPDVGAGGRLIKRVAEHRQKTAPTRRGIPVTIPHLHCVAHRVELGLADAFKALAAQNELHVGWSEAITAVINQAATFYSTGAPKRLESLRKTATDQKHSGSLDEVLRISRNFDARWVASSLRTRKAFARMFKIMFENLMEYEYDLTKLTGISQAPQRNLAFRAKTFLMIFRDIRFYSYLTFEIQLLECVEFLSLEAQRRDGTVIDFPRAFNEFKKCITAVSKDPFKPYTPKIRDSKAKKPSNAAQEVPFLKNVFVMEAKGPVPIKNSKDGIRAIFGDPSPNLHSLRFRLDFTKEKTTTTTAAPIAKDTFFDFLHPLPPSRSQSMTPDKSKDAAAYAEVQKEQAAEAQKELDENKARDSMLYKKFLNSKMTLLDQPTRINQGNAIIDQMENQFYDKILEQAELFTVRKLLFDRPTDPQEESRHKASRKELCESFNLVADEVEFDIEILRKDFDTQVSDEAKTELRNAQTDVTLFHTALKDKACYGPALEMLIERLIIIAPASASVERGYSVFNHYMSKRRTRLNIPHMEAYVFIHVNGPDPRSFVHGPYATEWLASGHRATEILIPGQEEEESDDDDQDEEEEEDHPEWANALKSKKNVPRIQIFDN